MPSWFSIFVTFLFAIFLTLLPMPEWAMWARPAWVLLVLIYWTISAPARVGVGIAWLIGILMDLIQGTVIGEHAFAYTVVIYFVSRIYIRLAFYPLLQQSLCVLFFCLCYQLIIYCTQGFIGELPNSSLYWLQSVTSMLLWPWAFMILRDYKRWFRAA